MNRFISVFVTEERACGKYKLKEMIGPDVIVKEGCVPRV